MHTILSIIYGKAEVAHTYPKDLLPVHIALPNYIVYLLSFHTPPNIVKTLLLYSVAKWENTPKISYKFTKFDEKV